MNLIRITAFIYYEKIKLFENVHRPEKHVDIPEKPLKEPLSSCESGMQGKASRSETRSVSEREGRVERGPHAAMRPIVHSIRGSLMDY